MSLRFASLSFFGPWSFSMKYGMLLGILGISSSVGLASVVVNGEKMNHQILTFTKPVSDFIGSNLKPKLEVVVQGASSIFGVFGGWSQFILGKDSEIFSWLENRKFSDVLSGFKKIESSFENWFEQLKGIIAAALSSKDAILE